MISNLRLHDRTAIPHPDSINSGLHPTGHSLMNHFGAPGELTRDCSAITNRRLKRLIVTRDVGPFRVSGLLPAVETLSEVFDKVRERDPQLHAQIKTAGVLCNRLIRGAQSTFSIHSWGAAIDLYCGGDVVPLGSPFTHVGVLRLYPYLHNAGFYWGAEFKRDDAMHFEASRELVTKWIVQGRLA